MANSLCQSASLEKKYTRGSKCCRDIGLGSKKVELDVLYSSLSYSSTGIRGYKRTLLFYPIFRVFKSIVFWPGSNQRRVRVVGCLRHHLESSFTFDSFPQANRKLDPARLCHAVWSSLREIRHELRAALAFTSSFSTITFQRITSTSSTYLVKRLLIEPTSSFASSHFHHVW